MRTLIILTMMAGLILTQVDTSMAQIKDPVKQTEKEGERRVNRGIDRTIDRGFDKLEEGIGGLFRKGKRDKTSESENSEETGQPDESGKSDAAVAGSSAGTKAGSSLIWAKYDFVPGDKIIFEDNLIGEENGEFPSRWDLREGSVEMAVLDNENVIMFREYASVIVPYMKDPESDYLPDIFTIEFDAYIPNNNISVYLYDMKNQNSPPGRTYLDIWGDMMEFNPASSKLPGGEKVNNQWAHVAVAFTKGQLKAYLNETRLINIPHLSFNPTGISIRALHSGDKNHFYIKNIRIAEGGVKYYDRFMQDGKIIANGIRFDVGKATLRPESMGVINEIYKMLSEHPDVNVSVEGHTDSDGDADMNQQLSEDRAETVKNQLISMGISASRLSSKGLGESMPIDNNSTPEGKAENRRVEFVKK